MLSRWFAFIAGIIFMLTDNLTLWAIGYTFLGLSGGMAWIIGDALLATLPPPEQRAKVMSAYMFLVNFNIIIGPLLVALLGVGHLAFVIGALIVLLNLIMGYMVQFPQEEKSEPAHKGLKLLMQIALPIGGLLLVSLSSGSFEGSATKMLPVQAFGLGYSERMAALAAVASGAGNLVSQIVLMALLKRFTAHQLVVPGSVLLAVFALLIIPASVYTGSYYAVLFMAGGIAGALYTLVVLDVTREASSEQGMQRISCIAAFYTMGGVLGPLLAGGLMEWSLLWGYSAAMAVITLVALAFYLRFPANKAGI